MVRGSEGVGAGLTGGGGVGSGPAMGLGGSELPPPPPQAVKTATAANTRGRDVICTSASGRGAASALFREPAWAMGPVGHCPLLIASWVFSWWGSVPAKFGGNMEMA